MQALHIGSKLPETGFNHLHLFPSQAEINPPEGDYIKEETSGILMPVDFTHTVSTNHVDSSATSKPAEYPLGFQVIAPSPCINNACHPPLTRRQCYPVFSSSIVHGDMPKPLQRDANHCSGMLSTCCDLVGNSGTSADSSKEQQKFDSGNFMARPKDGGPYLHATCLQYIVG